jgi:hypothetical protein
MSLVWRLPLQVSLLQPRVVSNLRPPVVFLPVWRLSRRVAG